VEISSALAEQLQLLDGDPDHPDSLAAGLTQLTSDLAAAVPSLLAVSITLVRLDSEVVISVLARDAAAATVLASLAVPLSDVEPDDLLILRAGEAGVFLLLADDLVGLLGSGCYPNFAVDRHLKLPAVLPGESWETGLGHLRAVNQAIGVLLDRGLPPDAALALLRERAVAGGTTVGAVSRLLLESMSR
jgi:hypothetical protein